VSLEPHQAPYQISTWTNK